MDHMDLLRRLARGLAEQFGADLEVVVHDLAGFAEESTIVAIENGHVSGRAVGDGPSQVVLEAMGDGAAEDRLGYYTKTCDGRMLKSSTIFIKDEGGKPTGVFSINHDVSSLLAAGQALKALTGIPGEERPLEIPTNVNALLEQLIEKSTELVGKPVALMTKEDKMRAVRFLSENGAFLITRSSDRVSKYFGISKYTLYSYFDAKEANGDGRN